MITPGKVEEWIREVEQRPESAATLIREIALRLRELTDQNEALLAENIALQSGKRVAEFKSQISNLEYQLEILKRQIGAAAPVQIESPEQVDLVSLLIYTERGELMRLTIDPTEVDHGATLGNLVIPQAPSEDSLRILAVSSQEELLFVFDSGRVRSTPVIDVPAINVKVESNSPLDWGQAFDTEPRSGETLAMVVPIARMALYDYCLQTSRKGYVKRLRGALLPTYIAGANIGGGVVLPLDKTFELVFCQEDDRLVLVSREGYLLRLPVKLLPYTIEDGLRLSMADYVVSAFVIRDQEALVVVTNNGMVFHREVDWLEDSAALGGRGRAILSKSRREAGMNIIAGSAVRDDDWGVTLTTDGALRIYQMSTVLGAGSLLDRSSELRISGFTIFSL